MTATGAAVRPAAPAPVGTPVGTGAQRWLPFPVPPGDVRLYCLPHAGGSASAFRPWMGRLGPVAVCPVQPPGRETRLREDAHRRMGPLVAELAAVVLAGGPGPYAVYGHSLGGLVGFELVREIRRLGGPDPVHLVVSGCPAPHVAADDHGVRVADMTDTEVVGLLRVLGGTPEQFLTDRTVLRMILPPVRADFSVKETYRYRPAPPLDVPITVLAATDDPRADPAALAAWHEQTSGRFDIHTLLGGHFAVLEQPAVTHAHIRRALGV